MATINVSGASQLNSAFKSAKAGDTILLAGGNYGDVIIPSHVANNGGLTIRSASESNQAVFKTLTGTKLAKFTIDNVKFDSTGGASGGSGGLKISFSTDIKVLNSDFTDYKIGSFIREINGLVMHNNTFERMYHDAMNFTAITNGVISNNVYRETNSEENYTHKDFIQFWTNQQYNQKASKNVQIINNRFYSDDGDTHGIFINNEWHGQKYENITIANNYLQSSHTHGLTVSYGNNINIHNNILTKDGSQYPMMNVTPDSTNVKITYNTAPSIPDQGNSTWVVSNNKETGGASWHWTNGLTGSKVENKGAPIGASIPGINGKSTPPTDPVTPTDPTPNPDPNPSPTERIVFKGSHVKGTKTDKISDIDFSGGDTIVLVDYNTGTFKDKNGGNLVWHNLAGTYVDVNSLTDLQEMVAFSEDITARISGDTLYLTIDQAAGKQTIIFSGLGSEYQSTYNDALF